MHRAERAKGLLMKRFEQEGISFEEARNECLRREEDLDRRNPGNNPARTWRNDV
jgi:hypothetical protein